MLISDLSILFCSLSIWFAAGWGWVPCFLRRACALRLWTSVLFALEGFPGAMAMPMFPRTPGERTKAAQRMAGPPVPSGRLVLPATQQKRNKFLDELFLWSIEEGLDLLALFERHQIYIDDTNVILER